MRQLPLVIICVLSLGLIMAGTDGHESTARQWRVQTTRLTPGADPDQRGTIDVSVSDLSDHSEFVLSAQTYAATIVQTKIVLDKLIVIAKSDGLYSAMIFSLPGRIQVDYLIGYDMSLLGDRWVVYVEYYPNHSQAVPTDVVLIYDLRLDAAQNRSYSLRSVSDSVSVAQRSGLPVFPTVNRQELSYNNLGPTPKDSRLVLPGTFCLLNHRWLVFIASTDGEYSSQHRFIVEIDISRGARQAAIVERNFPPDVIKELKAGGNIDVSGIQAIGHDSVQINFPAGQYSRNSIVIPVP